MAASKGNGSFFGSVARRCARHPWVAICSWIMLLAIGGALFATVFAKNMTTVTKFTTGTESTLADELFIERFPRAAYKVENAVITAENLTADDPEFWAYVDGLYAKLQPLMESGVVKGVQYYDPAMREGLPLMPGILQQMVDAIEMVLDEESTSARPGPGLRRSAGRGRPPYRGSQRADPEPHRQRPDSPGRDLPGCRRGGRAGRYPAAGRCPQEAARRPGAHSRRGDGQ